MFTKKYEVLKLDLKKWRYPVKSSHVVTLEAPEQNTHIFATSWHISTSPTLVKRHLVKGGHLK